MSTYELTHLSDRKLLHGLSTLVAEDRRTTAVLLAHMAEVDARRLYAPLGFTSMFVYCVRELRLSEDAAYKRIQVARTARQFPALFTALADGQLHLTGVNLLAPHLIRENADRLIRAAAGKTKSEIERLLAQRFPQTEPMPLVLESARREPLGHLAPAQVESDQSQSFPDRTELAPAQVQSPASRSSIAPIAPQRFEIRLSIDQATHDKLRYVQALLSHKLPSGDMAQVLELALDTLVTQLEKHKFAATKKPRESSRPSTRPRTIPARVKRAVWNRDGGRCTFVSEDGHRCNAKRLLEYDHVEPIARGGETTVQNLRLRCRTHNQLEAERAFGVGFMQDKREAARLEQKRTRAESDRDVNAALRSLGYRAHEARQAAEFSRDLATGPLEERVRLSLAYFRPRVSRRQPVPRSRAA